MQRERGKRRSWRGEDVEEANEEDADSAWRNGGSRPCSQPQNKKKEEGTGDETCGCIPLHASVFVPSKSPFASHTSVISLAACDSVNPAWHTGVHVEPVVSDASVHEE